MSSYYYTYDASGNVSSVVYTSNLSISGITIPSVPVYSYPVLSLSSLIYTPITISNYISLSGLFSGYSSYLSLSGIIASSNFFNYLTSSSYISPFTTNYTISSNIYSIATTPYINSTPWNKQYSTYLLGTLDISSTLIVRGNIICPNITGIDQYARNYEISLSGYVWSYYNYLGLLINSDNNIDQYSRLLNVSLSNIVYSNYLFQGNQINNLTSSSIDPYSRLLNISLSNIVYSNYLLEGNKINNLNFSSNDTFNRLVTLSGIVYNNYFTQGNLINNNTNIDQYARNYQLSLSGNINYQYFKISALEYKTTALNYNGSSMNTSSSIYLQDNYIYLRNDNYHYIKYGFRDGPCIAGNAGLSLGISNPSYSEVIGFSPSKIELQKPVNLNDNALYLRGDTNHSIKYDSTRDGPQIMGYGGGSLGALNGGVYSEIIGYNNTSIQLNKPVYCNYNLIVTNDINCNGNLNHGYLYISSSGTYNLSMSAGYKYVFINASNVYINLGQGANYTNIIYFINLNGSNNVNYTVYGSLNNNWLYSSLWLIWCPNNTWKYFTM